MDGPCSTHGENNNCIKQFCRKLELQICFLWRCDPTRVMACSFLMFLDHTKRRTTVGRTPLYEWSARLRDRYLTTHNTHKRQTSMSTVGFGPTISACERPQSHVLDHAANGTGNCTYTGGSYICQTMQETVDEICTIKNVVWWRHIVNKAINVLFPTLASLFHGNK
jgi:hypothetical protein